MATATMTPETSQAPTAEATLQGTEAAEDEPSGKIIYTCQVDNTVGHDQICMINANGTGFTKLTSDLKIEHFYPSWAPDGNSFVFSGTQNGTSKIYEMELKGNMKIVGDIPGELYSPVISPDGKKIAFERYVSDKEQYISVVNRDGSSLMDLVEYYGAKDPAWSPDGKKILFTASEDGKADVYYMNSTGVTVQKVSALTGFSGRPDWSSDWAIATYSGGKDEHNREIVLMEMNGKPVTITNSGDNLSPSFSPDGQWITFTSYRDNYWKADGCEIYIMRKDGTDIRRLTNNIIAIINLVGEINRPL
jgi:Tol biopolymer transport system component